MSTPIAVFFVKDSEDAVVPTQSHKTDAGYDLTIIRVHEEYGNGVVLYDTGISVRPIDEDIYFDLIARSSLAKKGYMLANGVGAIDNGYRGNIMIQLLRFAPDAEPLVLPMRVAQLIPRKMQPVIFQPDRKRMKSSQRGVGGFGSTDSAKK